MTERARSWFEDDENHMGGCYVNFSWGNMKNHPFTPDRESMTQVQLGGPMNLLGLLREHW